MGERSPGGGLLKLLSAAIPLRNSLTVDHSFSMMRLYDVIKNEFAHLRQNCLTLVLRLADHL